MKKIKIALTTFFVFGIFTLLSIQKAFADILVGDGWGTPNKTNVIPSTEPKIFIDLIEPQHIMAGGAVLATVIISFIVLFKMRKK